MQNKGILTPAFGLMATALLVGVALNGNRESEKDIEQSLKDMASDTYACTLNGVDNQIYSVSLYPETRQNDLMMANFKIKSEIPVSKTSKITPSGLQSSENIQIFNVNLRPLEGNDDPGSEQITYSLPLKIDVGTKTALFHLRGDMRFAAPESAPVECIIR